MGESIKVIDYDAAAALLGLVSRQKFFDERSIFSSVWIGFIVFNLAGVLVGLFMYQPKCVLVTTYIRGFRVDGEGTCLILAVSTASLFAGTLGMVSTFAEAYVGEGSSDKVEKDLGSDSSSDVDLEYYYGVYSLLGPNASLEDNDFSTYNLRGGKVHGRNTVTVLCHGDIDCIRIMYGVEIVDSSASQTCLKHSVPEEFTIGLI